jgi:hypothetical protein
MEKTARRPRATSTSPRATSPSPFATGDDLDMTGDDLMIETPKHLKEDGADLWRGIRREAPLDSVARVEAALRICECADRLRSLQQMIDAEGVANVQPTILRQEAATRAQLLRSLRLIGKLTPMTSKPPRWMKFEPQPNRRRAAAGA